MARWPILRKKAEPKSEERYNLSQFAQEKFNFGGVTYPLYGGGTYAKSEQIANDFQGYCSQAYKANGIVFACMLARAHVFQQVRWQYQRFDQGRPQDLFGDTSLRILENPWPNGTTIDLNGRAIQHVDTAGNFYLAREGDRLRWRRPDWMEIILTAPPAEAAECDIAGYKYTSGGIGGKGEVRLYLPEEVCHWAPNPDPEALFRGMSWLTPVLREIEADQGYTLHKKRFVDNAATPNISVALKETVTQEQFQKFIAKMENSHRGATNAYRTLYLGGGADVKVLGADMKQLDFKATQGAGETRIAAAARVHPVIVGLSEGMQGSSLNAGNFKAAKDSFADQELRFLWSSFAGALQNVVTPPAGARLWYDDRDVPFLRADMNDRADVMDKEANIIRTLVDGGFKPDTVRDAVIRQDWNILEHTGFLSVQLLPPGATTNPQASPQQNTANQGQPSNTNKGNPNPPKGGSGGT